MTTFKLPEPWLPKKFRTHDGCMLTIDERSRIFARPVHADDRLNCVEFQLLTGRNSKTETRYVYVMPSTSEISDETKLKYASQMALKYFWRHLRQKMDDMTRCKDGLDGIIQRIEAEDSAPW